MCNLEKNACSFMPTLHNAYADPLFNHTSILINTLWMRVCGISDNTSGHPKKRAKYTYIRNVQWISTTRGHFNSCILFWLGGFGNISQHVIWIQSVLYFI